MIVAIDRERLKKELKKKNNKDLMIDMYIWLREMNGSVCANESRSKKNEKAIAGFITAIGVGFIGLIFWLVQQYVYLP